MSDRELADRFQALETLTIQLIRTMHRTGVVSDRDRDQVLDSLEEISCGDAGLSFAAQNLAESISPPTNGTSFSDGLSNLMTNIAYKRRLYGPKA